MVSKIQILYLVDDVDMAVEFYTSNLNFRLEKRISHDFAILEQDGVELLVSHMPLHYGIQPPPRGWNRFRMSVDDLESFVSKLKEKGIEFKNEIFEGPGGKLIVCMDPSGNLFELVQPD